MVFILKVKTVGYAQSLRSEMRRNEISVLKICCSKIKL